MAHAQLLASISRVPYKRAATLMSLMVVRLETSVRKIVSALSKSTAIRPMMSMWSLEIPRGINTLSSTTWNKSELTRGKRCRKSELNAEHLVQQAAVFGETRDEPAEVDF